MKILITKIETCEVDTDLWRDYIRTDISDSEISAMLYGDNGQFTHLLGTHFGWRHKETKIEPFPTLREHLEAINDQIDNLPTPLNIRWAELLSRCPSLLQIYLRDEYNPYRCESCTCNVFSEVSYDVYKCNDCGAQYANASS